ncbi:MAG: DUF3459 domain-containing protein, partial [Photobacterium aquimaris]|nr:DUF3459 domain-containing protein [Photobacterium aquimaris]
AVNPNYSDINVEQQLHDPSSILQFYKQLIALRKNNHSLIVGRYQLLLDNDTNIYAYQRSSSDHTWTIITNLSDREVVVDLDSDQLGELVLDNQTPNNEATRTDFTTTHIAPAYAAYVFVKKH